VKFEDMKEIIRKESMTTEILVINVMKGKYDKNWKRNKNGRDVRRSERIN
jgi:hypothetical protein